jgi:hypothetical protein
MKPKRNKPLPWWTEYLGITLDFRFFARKTWKAYLLYIMPTASLFFTPATPLMKDRPPDVDPHLPSHAVTFEGPSSLEGASSSTISIQVSDDVSVMDHELVTMQKTSAGGSSSVPPPIGQRLAALFRILQSWNPEPTVAHIVKPHRFHV